MPNKEQNITLDDFEKSLKEEGIEVIVPGQDEDEPVQGIGAVGYVPRTTAPSYTNPYYLKQGMGGYNRCILIQGNSCLANCVGFAHGRLLEEGGSTGNPKIPTCNAEDWFAVAKANGLKTGITPKQGAVIVWKSGNFWNGYDGCGHVGVVEEVYPDGSILVSQSNYGGTRFFLTKHKPPYNIFGQTFVGFVYSPYITEKSEQKPKWVNGKAQIPDGTVLKNQFVTIDGKVYHTDSNGNMQKHQFVKENGVTYFMLDHGVMAASRWCKISGNWYFFGRQGEMFIGKHHVPVMFDKNGVFIGNQK